MSNEAKLGTVPNGNEGRDAVHVAIVPVIAAHDLARGTPVKLNKNSEAEVCRGDDAIGIVDPFRPKDKRHVTKGSWFWLCLYPKTITGLRHVWEHPSLPLASTAVSAPVAHGNKSESEAWLKSYVQVHCPYWECESDGGYSSFLGYVDKERWIYYYGSNCHGLEDVDDAEELFRHLSVVLERRIDASYFEAFTCRC